MTCVRLYFNTEPLMSVRDEMWSSAPLKWPLTARLKRSQNVPVSLFVLVGKRWSISSNSRMISRVFHDCSWSCDSFGREKLWQFKDEKTNSSEAEFTCSEYESGKQTNTKSDILWLLISNEAYRAQTDGTDLRREVRGGERLRGALLCLIICGRIGFLTQQLGTAELFPGGRG